MRDEKLIITYEIVAGTWSGDFGTRLDLDEIAATFPHLTIFDHAKYPAVHWREGNKTAMFLFASGKFIVLGKPSRDDAKDVVQDFMNHYKTLFGFEPLDFPEIRLDNMVASGHVGFPLDQEELMRRLPHAIYEPEQYPAVIWRVRGSKVTVNLFNSGAFIITGASSEAVIEQTIDRIREMVLDERT